MRWQITNPWLAFLSAPSHDFNKRNVCTYRVMSIPNIHVPNIVIDHRFPNQAVRLLCLLRVTWLGSLKMGFVVVFGCDECWRTVIFPIGDEDIDVDV